MADTALVVVGVALLLAGFVLLVYLWRTGRIRLLGSVRSPNAPLAGIPMKEVRRIGRLARSGSVVPSDDAERVRAYVDWWRRMNDGVPIRALLPVIALLGAGDLAMAAGTDNLMPLRVLIVIAPLFVVLGAVYLGRKIESKIEALERANGWTNATQRGESESRGGESNP